MMLESMHICSWEDTSAELQEWKRSELLPLKIGFTVSSKTSLNLKVVADPQSQQKSGDSEF